MERNLILTVVLIFVYLSNGFSQCNIPAAPGLSCQTAIAFCNNELDGYCSATFNSGVGTNVSMPPFCGSVQNNLWIQFVAGTPSISLEFTITNCLNGDGLQAMVLHSDDCTNFTGITNCYTASTSGGGGGTSVFTLDANNYEVGETYYVMIDGWLGDYCDFAIDVLSGSTGVAPLAAPAAPSGNTLVCPGANSITYSIPAVSSAVGYNWSVPSGATYTVSDDELSITVNYSTFATSGNICVQAFNDCDVSSQTCLPITVQNLAPTEDNGAYCAGSTFFYTGNNTNYTQGTYYITLAGASYQGCDSIVQLEVVENPIKETFLIETICEGETFEVGGIPFDQTNASISVPLTSYLNCDSIVYLDLTVLDPKVVLQQPEAISCNNQDVFINGVLSNADTYFWSTATGNIISGQGTPLITVDAGGTYELMVTMSHMGVSCMASDNIFVDENYEVPTLSLITTDLSCGGIDDGTASVTATGGAAPYTYAWSTGAMSTSINNLGIGTYTVTVSGANDCDVEETFTISEPSALTQVVTATNISCHGTSNGAASTTASGGQGPYTYQWSSGGTATTENNLGAGNYTVTVTDANLCTKVDAFEITEPSPIVLSINDNQPLCNNDFGTTTVTASGGTGTLTYLWDDGMAQTTPTAINLSAGIYTVIVSDQNNCTQSISTTIQTPSAIQVSLSKSNPTCPNATNGTATVSAIGGTGALTYAWNTTPTQQTTTNISNLSAGTYEVTVTDQNGCSAINSIALIDPTPMTINISTQDILCFGNATGIATASVTGGASPYTFSWDDFAGQNSSTATGLIAGIYEVTVTDANNCIATQTVTITEPSGEISISGTSSPSTCGGTNGTIDLTVSGGVAPYDFTWTNGIPAVEDPSGLGAGTYAVIVTDANACSSTFSIAINTPTGLEAMIDVKHATCNGAIDGAVDLTVVGGNAPYNFVWSDPTNNGNEDYQNINAGNYSVTVTDNDGCSVVATGIVEEPVALTGTASPMTASCGIADGSITLTINGGTTPYNFDWSESSYDGQQNLTGLLPGYYSVIVTDANGCSINLAADIIVPNGPVLTLTASDAMCNAMPSGSLELEVNGGAAPYTFNWNNGLANQEDHTNIVAGIYSVTVIDQNNCSAIASVTIDEPAAMIVDTDFDGVSCFGGNDGSAVVTVSGGMAPYSYTWNDGQTNNVASNLNAGTKVVTVTDANACTTTASINIPQATELAMLHTATGVSCIDATDGAIDLIVTGGTGAYDYTWSNGNTTEDLNAVATGSYSVTVTDANLCTNTLENISVTQPTPITITATATMASCNTANGTIDLNVNGGTGTYSFAWSNGVGTIEDPTDLVSGMYEVTVTDGNTCTAIETIEVASPSGLSATALTKNTTCFGATDGAIEVTIAGGLAPFSYSWSNSVETTKDLTNITAGDYTLTILDANNCSTTISATVQEPTELTSLITSSEATCGESNGAAFLVVSGGTAPYTYVWSNGSAVEDPTGLAAGNYEVTISDANGCATTNSVAVLTPNQLTATPTVEHVTCKGSNTGSIRLEVSGGLAPYTFNWDNGVAAVQNPSNLIVGLYAVTVTDDLGCAIFLNAEIQEPEELNSTTISTYESCGSANGTIDITVSGGTLPYSFQWQDGIGDMEDPIGLSAGIYLVTVTDANNCEHVTSAEVTTPPPYFINTIATPLACNGDNNAALNLNVEGGIPPYSFAWSSGQTTEDLDDLGAGDYSVTVTDSEGCSITHATTIEAPVLLEAFVLNPIQVSCNGQADGAIVLEVIGGNPDYSFDWNDDTLDGQQNLSNLIAGIYEVTVSDAEGCTTSLSTTITEPTALAITGMTQALQCFGDASGAIDLNVSGGTPPYTFDWNNGMAQTEDLNTLEAGQYNILVVDANNCSQTAAFALDEPAAIAVTVEAISDYNGFAVSCDGARDGFVEVMADSGAAPYDYQWETGVSTANLTDVPQGIYTVTVSDVNACTITSQVELTAPTPIQSEITLFDPTCHDENDGQILIDTVFGGIAPYEYVLNETGISTTPIFGRLESGGYELMIQDANGCASIKLFDLENPIALEAYFDETILNIQLGESIELQPRTNLLTEAIDTFFWDAPALLELNPLVQPTDSEIYTFTVVSDQGCEAEADIEVKVKKDRLVYVPNIFTPNNDGLNDYFFPQFGPGVTSINTFQIFDRWGSLMFEYAGFLPGDDAAVWNGNFRGKEMGAGVYLYFLEVVFADGRIEIYAGDVTLLK